jgi:hypothetical protein
MLSEDLDLLQQDRWQSIYSSHKAKNQARLVAAFWHTPSSEDTGRRSDMKPCHSLIFSLMCSFFLEKMSCFIVLLNS